MIEQVVALLLALVGEWVSRKAYALFQGRVGPEIAGPRGILQPFADIIKLLRKEEVVVEGEDTLLIRLGAVFSLAISLYLFSLLKNNLPASILLIIALLSIQLFIDMLVAYAQPNPFAYIAGGRWAELFAAYEVPLLIAILTYTLLSGSFSIKPLPAVIYAPISALVFFIAAMAKLEKNPFSIPNAESEISAGWLVDISSRNLAMFRLSADLQALFLGTLFLQLFFSLPFYPALFLSLLVILAMAYVRARTARLRIDQALRLMWKQVTALALFNYVLLFVVVMKWL